MFTLKSSRISGRPFQMVFAIESQQLFFSFNDSSEMDGPTPQLEDVFQSVPGVIQSQIRSFMPVVQQELPPVFEIAIGYLNDRLPKVRQSRKEFLLHAFPIGVGDFVNAAVGIKGIDEELVVVAELLGEESIDE